MQCSEYTESLERNKQRVEEHKELYRKRQAIVEPPFGTIKQLPKAFGRGFSYVSTKKTKQRASAEIGFMMIAYNLKRILNIIGLKAFREFLEAIYAALNRFLSLFRLFSAPILFLLAKSYDRTLFFFTFTKQTESNHKMQNGQWFLDGLPLPIIKKNLPKRSYCANFVTTNKDKNYGNFSY